MRPRFRSASTDTSYDRRLGWRPVGRGAAATFLLVAILVVSVCTAATASAGAPSNARSTASAVLERPAGGESLKLLPGLDVFAPGPSSPAIVTASGDIVYDGFEGASSAFGVLGDPTWAITTYRKAAGTHSAYCAGSKSSAPGPYASNMNAWLVAGPFDLSAVSSATLQYKTYFVTEINNDWIQSMVSTNGDNFYGWGDSGNSQAWVDRSRDLTAVPTLGNVCGKSQVWVAFIFQSDSSVTAEGAYVDEVILTGSGGGSGGDVGLVLDGDRSIVPFAGRVNLTGVLLDVTSGSLLPNQQVGLFWSQEDKINGTWNLLDTYTSSTGEYSMAALNVQRLTYFAMVFAGDGRYSDGMSNLVKVMARAKLTPPAVPSRVRAGPKITSWGTLKPLHTAEQNKSSHTKVSVERYSGGRWRPVVSLYAQSYRNTSSETRYSVGLRYVPGKWRMRAVHRDSDHATTTSSWRTFTAN